MSRSRSKKSEQYSDSLSKITFYNMLLAEALFELLATKNIVTGEEVLLHVTRLMTEAPSEVGQLHSQFMSSSRGREDNSESPNPQSAAAALDQLGKILGLTRAMSESSSRTRNRLLHNLSNN